MNNEVKVFEVTFHVPEATKTIQVESRGFETARSDAEDVFMESGYPEYEVKKIEHVDTLILEK